PKGGAAFRVDLPPAPADAVRPALTPVHGMPLPNTAPAIERTILLVDADPAVQRTIKALFARDGHDVEVAGDPQHALDLAQRGGFDLVITDARAMAPGKRGTLLAEELVTRMPALRDRIIVATGDGRPTTDETLAVLGEGGGGPSDRGGGAGPSREPPDDPVRRHASLGDVTDHAVDPMIEWIHKGACVLAYSQDVFEQARVPTPHY